MMKKEQILLTLEQCIACKECTSFCSIHLYFKNYSALEKLEAIKLLINDQKLSQEHINTVFYCTKCEACQEHCPQNLPLIDLFDWARNQIFSIYGARNQKQSQLITNILTMGNPFNNSDSRLNKIPNKSIKGKIFNSSDDSKTLLHLGCMLGYRLHSMRNEILNIMKKLEIDYCLLPNEYCCGYFIYNTGDHDSAQEVIDKNLAEFEKFDKIICACAGCYIFFKKHYPDSQKFYHIIEIIAKKLEAFQTNGKLQEKKHNSSENIIAFHDSCHLTRPFGIIKPPRKILDILGYTLKEFTYFKEKGLCCGADGGMRIINPELARKIGEKRIKEAELMGTKTLFTLCPFCIFNFKEANTNRGKITIESLYQVISSYLEQHF